MTVIGLFVSICVHCLFSTAGFDSSSLSNLEKDQAVEDERMLKTGQFTVPKIQLIKASVLLRHLRHHLNEGHLVMRILWPFNLPPRK